MNRTKLSPFIHSDDTVNKVHIDLLGAIIPLVIISVVQNGLRVLVMCAISTFVAYSVETLGNLIKRNFVWPSFRVAILGVITTLLCPVTVPIWMPAVGVAFSVLFVRIILLKDLKNLFMSPAIGWLFLLTFWPNKMMSYPAFSLNNNFPIFDDIEIFTTQFSIAQYLQFGQRPPFKMLDVLAGMYPGGMGSTCIAAIFLITIFFLFRRTIAWQVPLSMIGTVTVFALVINRAGVSPLYSVIYELASSSFIYVAIFIAGDLINAPKLPPARVLFGIALGVVTMLLRYFGLYEHGVAFSLVIVNLLSGLLDRLTLYFRIRSEQRHRRIK